ncbi:amidase family protein [Brucella abortus]|nr:amidase family protein [Brucella abortus]
MRNAALAASKDFDFIISPTAPMPTYPAEWASPINDPQRPFEHIAFTVAMNMSEQPAISINCCYTAKGLPIGLQIFGQRFDDLGVLRLAKAYEDMRPVQKAVARYCVIAKSRSSSWGGAKRLLEGRGTECGHFTSLPVAAHVLYSGPWR